MNPENKSTDETESVNSPGDTRSSTPSARSSLLVLLALFIALLAAAFSAFNYQRISSIGSDTTVDDLVARHDRQFAELNNTLSAIDSRLAGITSEIATLEEEQARHEDTLRSLFELQGRDNAAWAVAEVENLLVMAIHRLTLERDINTSLATLEAANVRLINLGDPALLSVRRQLTADINALRSVNVVDISGLSLYLSDFVRRAAELPLRRVTLFDDRTDERQDDVTAPAWKRLLAAVWQEFRGMFVITRTGADAQATLLPTESYFIYQNLRLQLETARLAVVLRDTDGLQVSMEIIRSWLTEYFDTSDSGVSNLINTAERMSRLELDPALPDISSSLETLRAYIRGRIDAAPSSQGIPPQ